MVGVFYFAGTIEVMMNHDDAKKFVELHAQTSVEPTLSSEEIESILVRSRIMDRSGTLIDELGYVPSYWGSRAVLLALELKVAKAYTYTDFNADGTSIPASQIVSNLVALCARWRTKQIMGSV